MTAACLALFLLVLVPGAAIAQRSATIDSVYGQPEPAGGRLAHSAIDWGRDALAWLQAIFAADHGHIVPIAPIVPPAPIVPNP